MKSTQVDSEERKDMEESTMFIENMTDLDFCTINMVHEGPNAGFQCGY